MKSLFFLFVCFVPVFVLAQAPPFFLRGSVVDMNSGKPLKGALAKVFREDGSIKDSLFTEADGVFDAFALTVGKQYVLVVEMSGYIKASVEIDLNNIPDQVAQNMPGKQVDIQLIPLDAEKEKELKELEKKPNARFVYNTQSGKVDLDPQVSEAYSKQMNFVLKGDSALQEQPVQIPEPQKIPENTSTQESKNENASFWLLSGVLFVLVAGGFFWWRKNTGKK